MVLDVFCQTLVKNCFGVFFTWSILLVGQPVQVEDEIVDTNGNPLPEDADVLEDGSYTVEGNNIKMLSKEDMEKRADGLNVYSLGLCVRNGNTSVPIPYARGRMSPQVGKKMNFEYVHTSDFNTEKNAMLFERVSLSPEEKYIIQA